MFINSTYGGTSGKRRRNCMRGLDDFGRQSENIINNSIWCNSNSVAQFILMTEIKWQAYWMRMDGWMVDWKERETWLLIIKLIERNSGAFLCPLPQNTFKRTYKLQGGSVPYSNLFCPFINNKGWKLQTSFNFLSTEARTCNEKCSHFPKKLLCFHHVPLLVYQNESLLITCSWKFLKNFLFLWNDEAKPHN